jgi:hypothetical protein
MERDKQYQLIHCPLFFKYLIDKAPKDQKEKLKKIEQDITLALE